MYATKEREVAGPISDIDMQSKTRDFTGDRERFAALLETTHDAVIAVNRRGLIIYWNAAAHRLFGYSTDEALGSNIEIIIPQRFVHAHREGMHRVSGGGSRHVIGTPVELSAHRKDGTEFPIELSLSAWEDQGAMFFGGIIRDISERKRQEQAVRESEEKLRALMETATDAIVAAGADGNIIAWNAAAARIFGYSEDEAVGQPLEIIIPEKFRSQHRHGMQRVASGGQRHLIGHTVEVEGQHKDGAVFPIELSLSAWDTDEGMRFCGIIRNITERRKNEAALKKSTAKLARQAARLKTANAQIKEKSTQLESLSQKLAKYLSHQVYNSIFEGERDVRIESYRKRLTVFFSDIQGFTELSDRVEAEVLTHVLNSYLNEMSHIANAHGGTIDKFIGDAIMIFFGDPQTRGAREDALACVEMALEMQKRLKKLQKQWQTMGIDRPLQVRMGINTGYCTVGNFGSEDRMDYTIVGSEVNLAHRLESLAETDQILISQSTWRLVKEKFDCSGPVMATVKGFFDPVPTYQVIGPRDSAAGEAPAIHQQIDGFAIELDATALDDQARLTVREILERALTMLEE